MTTDETQLESTKVVPLNRHGSSEPARPTEADSDSSSDPTELTVQENRHGSSEPAD